MQFRGPGPPTSEAMADGHLVVKQSQAGTGDGPRRLLGAGDPLTPRPVGSFPAPESGLSALLLCLVLGKDVGDHPAALAGVGRVRIGIAGHDVQRPPEGPPAAPDPGVALHG